MEESLLATLGTTSSLGSFSGLGCSLLLAHDVGVAVLALREGRLVLVALVAAGRKLLCTQAVLLTLVATGHLFFLCTSHTNKEKTQKNTKQSN